MKYKIGQTVRFDKHKYGIEAYNGLDEPIKKRLSVLYVIEELPRNPKSTIYICRSSDGALLLQEGWLSVCEGTTEYED